MQMFPCFSKSIFGIECPICGFQRSFFLLVKGNFIESFYLYPPLIPILILIVVWFMYLLKPSLIFKKRLFVLAVVVLGIILVSFITKQFFIPTVEVKFE